jgi:hypothetical protein
MTSHVVRLYALALAVLVFFLTWAAIAARPWQTQTNDPRLAALAAREQRLRDRAVEVEQIVERRFAAYRKQVTRREARATQAPAPTPQVRVVAAPPVTSTRSS